MEENSRFFQIGSLTAKWGTESGLMRHTETKQRLSLLMVRCGSLLPITSSPLTFRSATASSTGLRQRGRQQNSLMPTENSFQTNRNSTFDYAAVKYVTQLPHRMD